jgi:hypothetical protein
MTKNLENKTIEEITRDFLRKSDQEITAFIEEDKSDSDELYRRSRRDLLSILEAASVQKHGLKRPGVTSFSQKIVNKRTVPMPSSLDESDHSIPPATTTSKAAFQSAPMKLAAGSTTPDRSIFPTKYVLRSQNLRIPVWSTVGDQLLVESHHIPEAVSTILLNNFQYDLQSSSADPRYSYIIGHSYDQLLSQNQNSPINGEIEIIVELL